MFHGSNVALERPFPSLPCPGRLNPWVAVSFSVPLELDPMGTAFPCPDRKQSGTLRVFFRSVNYWILEKPGNT